MKESLTPSSPDPNNNDKAFKGLTYVNEQPSQEISHKESSTPSSSHPHKNDNAFKALTDVTEKLSQGRSDHVAITAIVGLVICFMTMICITGFVYH